MGDQLGIPGAVDISISDETLNRCLVYQYVTFWHVKEPDSPSKKRVVFFTRAPLYPYFPLSSLPRTYKP